MMDGWIFEPRIFLPFQKKKKPTRFLRDSHSQSLGKHPINGRDSIVSAGVTSDKRQPNLSIPDVSNARMGNVLQVDCM